MVEAKKNLLLGILQILIAILVFGFLLSWLLFPVVASVSRTFFVIYLFFLVPLSFTLAIITLNILVGIDILKNRKNTSKFILKSLLKFIFLKAIIIPIIVIISFYRASNSTFNIAFIIFIVLLGIITVVSCAVLALESKRYKDYRG